MKDAAEYFGAGFLQMISGVLLIGLFFSMLAEGGILYGMIVVYMRSICG